MAVSRKRREGSGGASRRDEYATRPPPRSGLLQPKLRGGQHLSGDELHARQKDVPASAERSRPRRSIPPIAVNRSSNQQESVSSAALSAPSLCPSSRQVALRGELSLTSPAWEDGSSVGVSPRLQPLPFPSALAGSARSLLEATTARLTASAEGESLQDLVMNARPRTRYARRELHRQGSAHALTRISTAPSTLRGLQSLDGVSVTARDAAALVSSRSTGALHGVGRPPSRQAIQVAAVHNVEVVLPGAEPDESTDDDDDTNFFLTELEAAARAAGAAVAAKLRVVARHITLGSFLLYGNPPALVAAVQHFTTALQTVEGTQDTASCSPQAVALTSLLQHHRGVALRELVVASASPSSNVALACTKHAFAAQRRALELAQRAQDPRLQARAVKSLGLLLLDAHAYGPALTHQQEALHLALEEKDRELEARVYANLGNLALAQLNFGHALSCHRRDLQLCSSKALDCRLGRARAHRNLSIVYAKLHKRDQQLQHEKEARAAEYNDGGAYLHDVATHTDSSVGNICLQPSTDVDPALVALVSQNLAELVRGLSALRSRGRALGEDDDSSITQALEHEWNTAEVDLEAALAIVSTEAGAAPAESAASASFKPPRKAANARHVSVRIDNYSSSSLPAEPPASLQGQAT